MKIHELEVFAAEVGINTTRVHAEVLEACSEHFDVSAVDCAVISEVYAHTLRVLTREPEACSYSVAYDAARGAQ